MLRILVIRHGETSWNKEKIFRGRVDISLSETGRQQVSLLGRRLRGQPIQGIYTSPLKRAVETALAVQGEQSESPPIMQEDMLIDIDYGSWEKKGHIQVQQEYPDLYQEWLEAPHMVHIPDGESLSSVRQRVETFLDRLIIQHDQTENQAPLVLVSHRVVIKMLFCAVLGLDNSHFWQIRQDTAALSMLDYQSGKFILTGLNDTCHLDELRDRMSRDDF
ncbi:MAG: histidine phosphatase family protein [bacterium]